MRSFTSRFPEIGPKETRVVVLEEDCELSRGEDCELPRGRYVLGEYYCDEEDCDCRRVVILVFEESTPGKVWATINYGWDPPETYATWAGSAIECTSSRASFWTHSASSRRTCRRCSTSFRRCSLTTQPMWSA